MATIIKNHDTRANSAFVKTTDGKNYYIDSCYTWDHGFETMVFKADENCHVTDWGEVYANWYSSYDEMVAGHENTVKNLELILAGWGEV